jgi:fructose-1,6-bisphosphatase II
MADCMCTRYARATEWAALAGARWLGRADEEAAEEAAANGMKAALDQMPVDGRIVIGSRAGEALPPGGEVGAGGDRVDLALDPIEGRSVVARGGVGAIAMLAVAPEGALLQLPDMYMRTIAVGPRARGVIDLDKPVVENVRAVAESFDRQPIDITALVLDRPRHHDLVEELRAAGTRIKLIGDGTVTAAISAAIRGTNDHPRSGSVARARRSSRPPRFGASAAGSRPSSGRRAGRRSRRRASSVWTTRPASSPRTTSRVAT